MTPNDKATGVLGPPLQGEAVFSIIVPTFNSAATLSACLESIENQTDRDWEVLILDGLSKDDTLAIARGFQERDPRFRLYSEADSGIYDAMNKGIARHRGQWLLFLGSDDKLFGNDTLESVRRRVTERDDVVYGNVLTYNPTDPHYRPVKYSGKFTFYMLTQKNFCHQAIVYHSRVFQTVPQYSLQYPIYGDWDFNLKAWRHFRFRYIGLNVAWYATTGMSARTVDHRFLEDRETIVASILRHPEESPKVGVWQRRHYFFMVWLKRSPAFLALKALKATILRKNRTE